MPGSTFDQYLIAKDQDILIKQSLTLKNSQVYFFLKLHNFSEIG